jgi:hypothetical protein
MIDHQNTIHLTDDLPVCLAKLKYSETRRFASGVAGFEQFWLGGWQKFLVRCKVQNGSDDKQY